MKNNIISYWVVTIMALILISIVVADAEDEKQDDLVIVADINVYSGMSENNPRFELSDDEIKVFESKLTDIPPVELRSDSTPSIWPGGVNIHLVTNDKKSYFWKKYIQINSGVVKITDYTKSKEERYIYYEDIHNIEGWIYDLAANKYGYPVVRDLFNFTSNHTTADIYHESIKPHLSFLYLSEKSFKGTVKQNTEIKEKFKIVSVGAGQQLEVTILTPEKITVNKESQKSFSIPPGLFENITIEIDTTEIGEIIGNIIIRSNDPRPEKSEVIIPVNYTIIPDAEVSEQELDYNKYLIIAIILITILLSLVIIYYKKFR